MAIGVLDDTFLHASVFLSENIKHKKSYNYLLSSSKDVKELR